MMVARRSDTSGELHELGLAAAARAIRNGEVCSEAYVGVLLERARRHADLKAFITIDDMAVRAAARAADRARAHGAYAPLLGVPFAVKDSYMTRGLKTSFGTGQLNFDLMQKCAVAATTLMTLTGPAGNDGPPGPLTSAGRTGIRSRMAVSSAIVRRRTSRSARVR
jgi:hypothetical protein